MKDATLTQSAAKPNAANTVNTNVIALPQQATRPYTTQFRVNLTAEVSTGANSKNITYSLYGSNESNGANATLMRSWVVAGNGTAHPTVDKEFYLDPEFDKAYIFASATGEANGGNAADGDFTIDIEA
jgi:hypothetical protein